MGDRRQHVRVDVQISATVVPPRGAGVAMMMEDLSLGGARFVGPVQVQLGERVHVQFDLAARTIDLVSEIVRVELRDMAADRVSVRFVEVPDSARAAIEKHVRSCLLAAANERARNG